MYAFPSYCDGNICKANSASAALNKWMKGVIGNGYVVHGLRHSLRDRLRGAGRDHLFAKTSTRNVGYLIECVGDVGLSSIKPVNAGQLRDHLIAKGLASTSIRRVLSSVKAI